MFLLLRPWRGNVTGNKAYWRLIPWSVDFGMQNIVFTEGKGRMLSLVSTWPFPLARFLQYYLM